MLIVKTLVESLQNQLGYTHWTVNSNLKGVEPADYFNSPAGGGNSLNWVLGHLVHARNGCLLMLGQKPVLQRDQLERYARGSADVTDADDGLGPQILLDAFNAAQEPLIAGLQALEPAAMEAPAPFSPSNNPEETVSSLLSGLLFHEAYHAGQLGVIRRSLGLKGVIA